MHARASQQLGFILHSPLGCSDLFVPDALYPILCQFAMNGSRSRPFPFRSLPDVLHSLRRTEFHFLISSSPLPVSFSTTIGPSNFPRSAHPQPLLFGAIVRMCPLTLPLLDSGRQQDVDLQVFFIPVGFRLTSRTPRPWVFLCLASSLVRSTCFTFFIPVPLVERRPFFSSFAYPLDQAPFLLLVSSFFHG